MLRTTLIVAALLAMVAGSAQARPWHHHHCHMHHHHRVCW
jgi:hypothetical protein